MDFDLYDDTYDAFCQQVKKANAEILEIGCGPGNITRYLLNKRPDFKIEATDVAPNMVELAQENNPSANCKVMDCRELGQLPSRYDAIICGFCLPYLSKSDCSKLIADASAVLHENGVLYFSTIEGDYDNSGIETSSNGEFKMFVYYYSEEFLQQELKNNGFELIELNRKYYNKKDGSSAVHLIFMAKNQAKK